MKNIEHIFLNKIAVSSHPWVTGTWGATMMTSQKFRSVYYNRVHTALSFGGEPLPHLNPATIDSLPLRIHYRFFTRILELTDETV